MGNASIYPKHGATIQSLGHRNSVGYCCSSKCKRYFPCTTDSNHQDFVQSFDDGPTSATSQLLDFLDTCDQKTTFFEIGSQVIQNYQLTQREYSSGHEIADHTWSHPDLTTLTPEQVYAELAWASYAIWAAIGQTPKLFRPPYGNIDDTVRQVAAQLGMTVISCKSFVNERLLFGPMILMIGKLEVIHLILSPASKLQYKDLLMLAAQLFC
jgi:peptidoglycan/xylan/chitin deacetylase (PgdA/CDA1 family)